MLHAPCSTLHAPRSTLHAPRSTLHAPCSMLHAPCSTLHAPRSNLSGIRELRSISDRKWASSMSHFPHGHVAFRSILKEHEPLGTRPTASDCPPAVHGAGTQWDFVGGPPNAVSVTLWQLGNRFVAGLHGSRLAERNAARRFVRWPGCDRSREDDRLGNDVIAGRTSLATAIFQ
jgi:hypothetical protein